MNPLMVIILSSFLSHPGRNGLLGVLRRGHTCWLLRTLPSFPTCSASKHHHSDTTDADTNAALRGHVTILDQNEHYLVVEKTPAVVCHHSEWTGSRSRNEVPILQRVREATGGRRVNLVHRLDRGCSGCLLMTWKKEQDADHYDPESSDEHATQHGATRVLHQAMQSPTSTKTYVALVRGEGILHGRDFRQEGWFIIDRPIANERGNVSNATTLFRFVAGQHNGAGTLDRPRASIVLCRPQTGRWHQIRRHLNGLSHPILGDSSHGNSKLNREYKRRYGMLPERTCLHLARLDLPEPTPYSPNGLHVACPLAPDMLQMLRDHMPDLLEEARPILEQEGILLESSTTSKATVLPYHISSSASSIEGTPMLQ